MKKQNNKDINNTNNKFEMMKGIIAQKTIIILIKNTIIKKENTKKELTTFVTNPDSIYPILKGL